MSGTPQKTRELTGEHVLFWFLGFFALVFAVNGVLVKAATSTFGGVETSSSYKAGLMFKQDIAAAEAQDALNWRVDGKIVRNGVGGAMLDISARNDKGAPLGGLNAKARLAHPADEPARPRGHTRPRWPRPISRRNASKCRPVGADHQSLPG